MAISKKVKIGIIGCGSIGNVHARSFSSIENAELVAFADMNAENLKKMAEQYGVKALYSDADDLINDENVDAVIICVPNFLHRDITVKALNGGKHVLCEKPMALNAEQAREMVDAAEKNDRKLMIALCQRFTPQSMALKSMIDDGMFGDIYHAQVVLHRRRGIPGLGGWFTTKSKSGGGPLIDIGVHVMDLTLHMMGYPRTEAVSAATYTKFGNRSDYNYVNMWAEKFSVKGGTFDVEDYATALVRLEGDMTMNLECAWAANIGEEQLFTMILGDKRGAKLSGGKLEVFGEDCGYLADFVHQYRESNNFENEARHFAQAILDNSEPIASGKEVLNLQLLIDGIYSSAEKKMEVKIGE